MTDDDKKLAGLKILRDNLEVFSAHCLKVKDKQGRVVPFLWNDAQRYIHKCLEEQKSRLGFVRALVLKGRQQGCCYAPEMRVLTTDFRWVSLADVAVGETLFAVDEEPGGDAATGRRVERRTRPAVIEAKAWLRKEAFAIVLSNGTRVVATGEHRHLCLQRGGCTPQWRTVSEMRVGDQIRAFGHGPDVADPFEDGWFGGLLDGEGSFGAYPALRIGLSQVDGPVLRRAKAYLDRRGIHYYELIDRRTSGVKSKLGDKPVHCIRVDRQPDIIRLMALTRPTRFMGRPLLFDRKLPKTAQGFDAWPAVVSIEPVGEMDVIDLQTSEKTFVCEGLVSHNSTYVGARFYHRTTMEKGQSAFIVAHEQKATDNLYNMVRRYHDHNVIPVSTGATNAKELIFDRLDGGYKLATAGTKDVGRSNTAQLLHGSEVSFWQNAEQHMAGLGNTIADLPGTEIILETTANGLGNYFHSAWQDAEAGKSNYIPIFVPWYWQTEYRSEVRPDLELSEEDVLIMKTYGLDMMQMQWRANKIASYGAGFAWLFKQEYPLTAAESFQSGTMNPLVSPHHVQGAAASDYYEESGALIIGCDPASDGASTKDRTCIVFRRGRVVFRVEYHEKLNSMQVAGKLAEYYRDFRPDAMFVDKGGIGTGIVDRLQELNVPVIGVMFGQAASDPEIYANKKAEMWWRMKDWFEEKPNRIVNDPAFIADICAPQPDVSSNGRKLLESKEKLEKRQIRSPDGGDALALTFAENVLSKAALAGQGTSSYEAASKAGY